MNRTQVTATKGNDMAPPTRFLPPTALARRHPLLTGLASVLLLALLASGFLVHRQVLGHGSGHTSTIVARFPSQWTMGEIAIDGRGAIYVGRLDDHVIKLSPTGKLVAQWQLDDLGGEGIDVDPQGNVYIGMARSIEKRSPEGTIVSSWKAPGDAGCQHLAVGPDGTIFSASLHTIYALAPGDHTFRRLVDYSHGRVIDRAGDRLPPMRTFINDLAVDRQGNLYVALENVTSDSGAVPGVQKFSAAGKLLAQWGRLGSRPGQIAGAQGIAVDGRGHVYVSDDDNSRIEQFSTSGRLLAISSTHLSPSHLAVDRHGSLYAEVYLLNAVDGIEKITPSEFATDTA